MASKGPRSKLEHETRAKRQKALDPPREPPRPKTHWDHVLEEMSWLAKDFESERKWKLAQAKKVALRANKGVLDQATREEKKMKEEEHRLRKIALNISKDVKKFWLKIEKLVLYKHQTALDEKRKKALDKQLEYLLGQTERYSTMLAENLVDTYREEKLSIQYKEENEIDTKRSTRLNVEPESDKKDADDDYNQCLEDELEDDEHTIEEDEAHITEKERQEEMDALRNEMDMPLDELLKRYTIDKDSREDDPKIDEDEAELIIVDNIKDAKYDGLSDVDEIAPHGLFSVTDRGCGDCNGRITISEKQSANARTDLSITSSETSRESDYDIGEKHYEFTEEQNDGDFVLAEGEEKDDEATLSEEEKLAKIESNDVEDEVALLQMESKLPIEELLARYKEHEKADVGSNDESEYAYACSDLESSPKRIYKFNNIHTSMGDDDEQQGEEEKLSRHLAEEGEEQFRAKSEEGRESENKIADAAAAARSAQPTGYTFSTTKVRTKLPFLLKYPLREYQHIGLDWLVTMYEKRLNGILADEMGLGKTIMTIALLAHLACEKGIWGPHLIVVPTSVMLNWETEFLKWCPAFKILTYFGSAKERKFKRQGWMKPNSFHVCVTTYRLVIQDSKVFKRKKWKYLILDEAHLIKNWKSQRWQTLLNFNSKRRILLTGTPLQNDLMELWSLMHFLMPHIFQSHQEFKDWFSNPISGMVEGQEKVNKEVIDRLHNVLRPFILRRLKRDVEKQLPMKHEHIIYCRLSRRQRTLYEDFIASSETQATLASANFFAMISVIMQLRKVCNHPDLFEGRPIVSSFDMSGLEIQISPSICSMLTPGIFSAVDLKELGFLFTHLDFSMASWVFDEVNDIATPSNLIKDRVSMDDLDAGSDFKYQKKFQGTNLFEDIRRLIVEERLKQAKERAASIAWWNSLRCRKKPVYSTTLRELVTVKYPASHNQQNRADHSSYLHSSKLVQLVPSPVERFQRVTDLIESFMFAIPAARAPSPVCWCSRFGTTVFLQPNYQERCTKVLSPLLSPIRPAIVRRQLYFPDRRLVQFDCGKLQELSILLRQLKSDGHRALIFTQMTKMLDILEAFINLYGYTYMRLDGSTQPEERQTLMQRFNTNPKIFLFILSTRSGGVGVNLVGADTVIFYDSDWNPAMDQQAQDRCHRIGQTREVHIYRLISESTIEENILKKANQKRALDDLVIQSGGYNTDFFSKLDPMELFSGHRTLAIKNSLKDRNCSCDGRVSSVSIADVDAALKFAEDEADYMALKKVELEEAVDNQEFTEEGIGKFEDDDLLNEEDGNADEPVDQGTGIPASSRENGLISLGSDPIEERAITFSSKEDEADLVADVKQIAALSSSSGQAISSFESRLRPIDRYAIRFLELCDPIVNKAATESQARFEETDWELDRIEKFKEDLEAEIDEGEEPLVYESWDADFATEAYRQQVEVLTQHQLLEQLENEAREKQEGDGELCDSVEKKNLTDSRSKSKKKSKKAKFKSLRKGSLASDSNAAKEVSHTQPLDGNNSSPSEVDLGDGETLHSSLPRKRKKAEAAAGIEEERLNKKKSKKVKKPQHILSPSVEDHNMAVKTHGESNINADTEPRSASRSKMGGKISITLMPLKRVLTIKQEKLKKKGSVWSRECFPAPDCWLRQEDALLSAVVHEYGPNWSLLSDTLYGATAGGSYRGIYRHPVHCCERFRELIHKVIFSSPETANTEKTSNVGSGKSLLRVTEDNIRTLLDISTELPDRELIIQKHFTALLSSVWRASLSVQSGTCSGKEMKMLGSASDQISGCTAKEQRLKFNSSALGQISKLLADALRHEVSDQHNTILPSDRRENASASPERLELSVQFLGEKDDLSMHLPPVINLSIYSSEPPLPEEKITIGDHLSIQLQTSVENRFRDASRACLEDCLGWASSAFPTSDLKPRAASKSHALGKHKLAFADSSRPKAKLKRTTEPGGVHHAISEPGIPAKPAVPCDPELRFEPTLPDASDFENTSSFLDKETVSELEDFEPVPHEYLPGFISGLDDYRLSPEYTGIG